MRSGVLIQDLITPSGSQVIYIMDKIDLPNTDEECANYCQDIMAEYLMRI